MQNNPPEAITEALTEEELAQIDGTSLEELFENLDAVEQTVERVEEGELPEDTLTPALESLIGIVSDLQEVGSISRADAQSIMAMSASMEGFDTAFTNMPLISFTELPSKVNYKPAMEGLISNVVRAIIDAIKKVIQFLREKGRALRSVFRRDSVTAAQAKVAAAKVAREHQTVTEEAIVTKARKEAATPSGKPTPVVERVVRVMKEATPSTRPEAEVVADALDHVRDELKRSLPDLFIEFYDKDLLSRRSADCIELLKLANEVLKTHDAVRFLGRVAEILEGMTGTSVKGNFDIRPLGEPNGAVRMQQNAMTLRNAMATAQVTFSKKFRTFDLVQTRDPLDCLNQIAAGLDKHKKAILDPAPDLTMALRYVDDQLAKFDQLVKSTNDTEILQAAQEKANLLQLVNSVVMFAHSTQCDINLYIGKMAKLVHTYRV